MWILAPRDGAHPGRSADVRALASTGALVALLVACSAEPAPPIARKMEGESCQVSAECGAALSCLDGVCATGGCRGADECTGLLPAGCEAWSCVSGRCEPACYPDGGPADAAPPRDATPAPDATPPADVGPLSDAIPMDVGGDAGVDSGMPSEDAMPSSDTGVVTPEDGGFPDANAPDATAGNPDAACVMTPRAPMSGDLLVNEILADPGDDVATGDANQDGARDSADDEFVEIANVSAQTLQLSGVVVADSTALRHRFAARTLACGEVVVVFGGGNTASPNWQSNWVTATTGSLLLNNSGDQVRVGTSTAALGSLVTETYGSSAGNNQSIVRSPELSPAAPFVLHSAHPDAAGRVFSPGVRASGQPF